ncbi:MAG: S41 family peptidase [Desulfarculaceae bacterium]|nr:S41 family peptidase [Desulfarculaceae bacterium]
MPGRWLRYGIFLILVVAITAFMLPQLRQAPAQAAEDQDYRRTRLLIEVMEQIQKKYVEKKTPDELLTEAIKGMVSSLDPHSAYLTPEEYKDLQVETKGSFSGVGIVISMKDGTLTVVSPIEDTPAFKAGVEAGDRIIKINGKLTKGMNLMDAVKVIRGPKGSKVTLTILREGMSKLKDISIVRDVIPIKSVRYFLLDDGYGLIRLASFQENTTDDLIAALNKLQDQKVPLKGLIIDLRTNPGGLLTEAVNVSDQFLDKGLIVSTRGRAPGQEMVFKATPHMTAGNYPIIVLVNQGSASASEIVAGALQDHHRAMILGTPSFGKGSVQTILPLEDKGALKLTTARYYTPAGRSIQAKGIIPDLEVPFKPPAPAKAPEKNQGLREADLQGAMAPEDNPNPPAVDKEEGVKPEAKDNGDDQGSSAEPAGKDKAASDKDKLYYPKERLSKDNQMIRALDLLKAWQVFTRREPPANLQGAPKAVNQ